MARQAIIRTGFASAADAAKIYGDSPSHVKEVQRLVRQLKAKASEKQTAGTVKKSSARTAKKAKVAAKRTATSRKASRRAA